MTEHSGSPGLTDHYDLAPCPFCGGKAYFCGQEGDPDCSGCHRIACSKCIADVDLSHAADPANQCVALTQLRRLIAVEWNTRVNL